VVSSDLPLAAQEIVFPKKLQSNNNWLTKVNLSEDLKRDIFHFCHRKISMRIEGVLLLVLGKSSISLQFLQLKLILRKKRKLKI